MGLSRRMFTKEFKLAAVQRPHAIATSTSPFRDGIDQPGREGNLRWGSPDAVSTS